MHERVNFIQGELYRSLVEVTSILIPLNYKVSK